MKTLIHRLADAAVAAQTAPGECYMVRLTRPWVDCEPDGSGVYEALGHSVPLRLLSHSDIPSHDFLGEEALETPWIVMEHSEGLTLVPLSRFQPHWDMYASR